MKEDVFKRTEIGRYKAAIEKKGSPFTTPELSTLRRLIKTIEAETRPIEGHPDPEALKEVYQGIEESLVKISAKFQEMYTLGSLIKKKAGG